MSKFPKDETNILALGREMADGFRAKIDIFPAPPIDIEGLEACIKARERAVAAQAAAEQATAAKNSAFRILIENMRTDLRYAENTVNDDAQLKYIGWSGRKPKTPLAAPGQVRALVVQEQGEGWIHLGWGKPTEGGKVAAYKVQRREPAEGMDWLEAGVAINKTGEGEASNTVTVVL
uniref:Fibronectin type III domain-containing protein n=1 Tax=Candidatus Kentrum sp. TUN TaxID=2126343 RepID=A0A450ZAV3_9GAMM|nr:MAG: hypothetical protein BECKTUN1418D_GA0071000_100321 [Candidatus Kentron sp. TUN]